MMDNASSTSEPKELIALIAKTWEMVTAGHEEISFSEDGAYIVVHNTERCAVHVMPQYFNHKVYASWVRGINACGFHKVAGREHRWFHPEFHRDHPEWLENIKRRAPPSRGRPGSSTASCSRRRSKPASTALVPCNPLSVADLHPERLRLEEAMAEEALLERAVAQIREEDFWQRFEAVRMVHMMLSWQQQQKQAEAREANPTITVLHPTVDPDATCPLLQLCERTSALQLCDKDTAPAAAGAAREAGQSRPPHEPQSEAAQQGTMREAEALMSRPVVMNSEEVQRLLDEHGTVCDMDCGVCEEEEEGGAEEKRGQPSGSNLPLPLPLPLPTPLQRFPSDSSAATADLPDAAEPHSTQPPSRPRAGFSLPLPPALADLPLPSPPLMGSALPSAPLPSALPGPPLPSSSALSGRVAMVPCAVEASRRLPAWVQGASEDVVCGSPACPLSRYGTHTHKTVAQLPPVGSAEREQLEEYVNRCFSTMTYSLAEGNTSWLLSQSLVPCA